VAYACSEAATRNSYVHPARVPRHGAAAVSEKNDSEATMIGVDLSVQQRRAGVAAARRRLAFCAGDSGSISSYHAPPDIPLSPSPSDIIDQRRLYPSSAAVMPTNRSPTTVPIRHDGA